MNNTLFKNFAGLLTLLLLSTQVFAQGSVKPAIDFDGAYGAAFSLKDILKEITKKPVPKVKDGPARSERRSDRDRRGRRGGGNDRGWGGGWDGQQVSGLARRIAAQAEVVRAKYRQEKPGNFFKKMSWRSGYNPLKLFTERSQRFQRTVRNRNRRPEASWDEYAPMIDAWESTRSRLPRAYHFSRVRDEYRKLEDMVSRLRRFYRPLERRRAAMQAVQGLSQELKMDADALQAQARALETGELEYEDRRFLDDLKELVIAADDLYREARGYRPDARSIRREAEDLVDAYERADRSFFAARKFETMRSSFRDFGSKIRRLEDSLEDLEGGSGGRDW